MHCLKRVCLLFIGVFLWGSATALAGGNTGFVKISELVVASDGGWVKVEVNNNTVINPDGCEGAGFYAAVEPSAELLSMLMSAFHAQSDARIYVNGCTSQLNGSTRPKIATFTVSE